MKVMRFIALRAKQGMGIALSLSMFGATGFAFAADPPTSPNSDQIVEDVTDMPREDLDKVKAWIKNRATQAKTPYCYRDSYGRTAGSVASACAPGSEKDATGGPAGLCYPKCPTGYSGVGPVCWQSCPSGFRDDGAFCAKPPSYTLRGNEYPWKFGDRAFSLDGARARCNSANPQGCQKLGEIIYPNCKPGYKTIGLECSPVCPPEFGTDIGVSCTKKTSTRGTGVVSSCGPGLVRDETGGPAGLCYPQCKTGFSGVGPVCWQACSNVGNGLVDCGAGCATSKFECGTTTFDQVFSVVTLAANIATLGLSSGGTAAAGTAVKTANETLTIGSKVYSGSTKTGKALIKVVRTLASNAPEVKNVSVVKRIISAKTGTTLRTVITTGKVGLVGYSALSNYTKAFAEDFTNQTSPEINAEIDRRFNSATAYLIKKEWGLVQLQEMAAVNNWKIAQNVLSAVSIVDISGVTGVVSAYTKPICGQILPFPTLSQSYK